MPHPEGTPDEQQGAAPDTPADERPSDRWSQILADAAAGTDTGEEFEEDDSEDDDDESDEEATDVAAQDGETQERTKVKPKVIERKAWGDLEKPTPAKIAVKERMARRAGQQQEAAKAADIRAQLEQTTAQHQQALRQQAEIGRQAKELADSGKVDEALKLIGQVTGFNATLGDLQRSLLKAKGGLPKGGHDPRVEQLEKQVNGFISAEQKRIAEQQQAARQAESEAQTKQDIADLSEEIAALPYEGADALVNLPGFTEAVYQDLQGGYETEAAVRDQRGFYQGLFEKLHAVALAGGLSMPGAQPKKGQRQAAPAPVSRRAVVPSNQPRSGRGTLPDNLQHHGRDRWEAIKAGKL